MSLESKLKEQMVEKIFYPKDVFYNNGIVNLYGHLLSNKVYNLEYVFQNNNFKIIFKKEYENEIYNELLFIFLDINNIVFQTRNDKIYWDSNRNTFVKDYRFDVRGKASGNDVLHGVYSYITAEKIGKPSQELYEMMKKFIQKNKLKIKEEEYNKIFFNQKLGKLKLGKKLKLFEHISREEGIRNFCAYLTVSEKKLVLDSKIHQFEDGQKYFKDMLKQSEKIDKWDALIYLHGSRIGRLFYSKKNIAFYVYLNSSRLDYLLEFKNELKINDEKIKYKDDKTEEIKTIPTNIDFRNQLYKNDGIKNPYFYISNSETEFEVKFFMYLFSLIFHIEDSYKKEPEERRKKRKEKLYNTLKYITFFTYTQEGDMKSSLNEYSKAYKLIKFFKKLKESRIEKDRKSIFAYLSELITALSLSKSNKEVNLNIKSFTDNLLNFKNLRKNYLEASFDLLKNNKGRLGKELSIFENLYLKEIKKEDLEMDLHRKSKIIGEGIGNFEAQVEDKNLLFTLRNIKNHKQLISYFKNFKFEVLKNQEKAKFNIEFINSLADILDELDKCPENWEIVRDYIAIYAIDKYKSVSYAKEQNKGGK